MIVATLIIKMWLVRNKLTVKAFTLDVSKGLDMKGNKVINVADPTSVTGGSNERHGDTKASSYLKTDGTRVMTGNLKMKNRSITNIKQA